MSYIGNVKAWVVGFRHLDTISYKPGWGPAKFLPFYLLNYGTRVLTGGACVSWSRWFYLHSHNPVAKFITRLLNKLDDKHGENAGPPLWGTRDTGFATEGAIAFWGGIVLAAVLLLG